MQTTTIDGAAADVAEANSRNRLSRFPIVDGRLSLT